MRLKRLFKRTEPADPFAAFAQTYGIRIPHDTPPPKVEPVEPQPHEARRRRPSPPNPNPPNPSPPNPSPSNRAPCGLAVREPTASGPARQPAAEGQARRTPTPRASPPKAEPAEPQPVEPGSMGAHQVLGVPLGALGHEVSQAHRKLALMHHPDKMASMGPEAEEYSEERMKEINAAYDELRRRGA